MTKDVLAKLMENCSDSFGVMEVFKKPVPVIQKKLTFHRSPALLRLFLINLPLTILTGGLSNERSRSTFGRSVTSVSWGSPLI